ncbi:uncharacterized protein LOC143367157 [Andrena cerasifolii]|uniref:uncharacterized protein LOC143367157 n=1 Tax=Andrena cerasifolii TaxID=2819439 RepID=UPI00403771DC
MYSAEEYYTMFWMYARNNGDASATVRALAREYPRIETPSEGTIRRLASRLHSTGSMMRRGSVMGRPRAAWNLAVEENVLDAIDEEPTVSVRDLSRRLDASRMTVHRILRENMLHPYSYVRVQHLHPGNGDQRVEGVTLMPTIYKIYMTLLAKRLESEMEVKGMVPDNQTGFRRGRGVIDQIYVLNYIIGREMKEDKRG